MAPPGEQFRSIDALRGAAMLLGVLLHALIPYLAGPIPHLLWPVHEPASGAGVDAAYWFIHGFRVPLFFVIAGVFASLALSRHGPRVFIRRRLTRIGIPLFIGTFTILPLMYLVWSWGWVRSGLAEPRHVGHVRFGHGMQQDLYGLAHLWFLEYLFLYSLLLCLWNAIFVRPQERTRRNALWWLLLPLPTVCVLLFDPRPLTEFHNWFWPRTAEFLYQGWFFAVGAALGARRGIPHWWVQWWWISLALSLPAFAWFWNVLPPVRAVDPSTAELACFALAASLFAWMSILGWVGLFLRFVRGTSRASRTTANAAYWIYVAHPPAVGLAQVLLYKMPWPVWAKISVSFVSATLICFVLHRVVWIPLRTRWQSRPTARPTSTRNSVEPRH